MVYKEINSEMPVMGLTNQIAADTSSRCFSSLKSIYEKLIKHIISIESQNDYDTEDEKDLEKTIETEGLYNIDIKSLLEWDISYFKGDYIRFKKWVIKKNKKKHPYIIINNQPFVWRYKWINWPSYRMNPYYPRYDTESVLRIWLCENWEFTKYVDISTNWQPETSRLINKEITDKLGCKFFIRSTYNKEEINPEIESTSPILFYSYPRIETYFNVINALNEVFKKEKDIHVVKWNESSIQWTTKKNSEIIENWKNDDIETDINEKCDYTKPILNEKNAKESRINKKITYNGLLCPQLNIKWQNKYKKYEKWLTWLGYIEFEKPNEYGNKKTGILIAEFNNWKIVWPCRSFWFTDPIKSEYLIPKYIESQKKG